MSSTAVAITYTRLGFHSIYGALDACFLRELAECEASPGSTVGGGGLRLVLDPATQGADREGHPSTGHVFGQRSVSGA